MCVCPCVDIYISMYVYAYIYTSYMYTYTHISTYTYIRNRILLSQLHKPLKKKKVFLNYSENIHMVCSEVIRFSK